MSRTPFAILVLFSFAAPARAQESAAPFDAPLVTLDRHDRYAFLTDFDHDGFQDAVSWWWWGAYYDNVVLRGYRNDGTGKLAQAWSKVVEVCPVGVSGGASLRVLPCQLDSDGLTDISIAYASTGHASIRVLRSNGVSAPALVDEYSVTRTSTSQPELSAVVTDFTGDGLADLAYALDGNLRLMEFVPAQSGLTIRSSTYPFGGPSAIVKGLLQIDANGDATPDLMAWRETSVALVEVQAGEVAAMQEYATGTIAKPAIGDIDGDSDQDLVMWNTTTYAVLRRTGPASWAIEPHVTGGPAEFLHDVDQDGDLDGVCCGGGGGPSTPDNVHSSIFRVSVNDGTGAFAPSLETAWLGSDHLAGVADLDHDGDMDVVAGRCILYSRGPLTQRLHPLLGGLKTERSTADIDGDSDPDFTVGLRIMERNQGDGGLSTYTASFPVPPAGTQFVGPGWPGDFDGDGDLDVVAKHRAGATLLEQRLIVNLGGGAFADGGAAGPSGVDFNLGSTYQPDQPDSSLAEDADGDGDVDLITLGRVADRNRSLVWWNDGSGHFTAGPELQDVFLHHVADLDGDGIPDLAGTVRGSESHVFWSEGLGGGAFGPYVELRRYGGSRFAMADLDSDGDLDFAVAYSSHLYLLWNDGAGVFTQEEEDSVSLATVTSAGQRAWSTDANGDGLPDLLVTGSENEANAVIVLLRKADNSGWELPRSQIVFTSTYSGSITDAVVRDVDGDGDEDFVTSRLMRNATHSQPDAGRRRQIEAGTPGAGGLVPTLGADGPFRFGEAAELRVRGGVGGATGLLTVTLVSARQRGPNGWLAPTHERVLAQVPFTLSGTPGVAGTGSWTRDYTVPPDCIGQTRRYVVEIFDAEAPGGIARSNTLLLSYGL